MSNEDKLMMCKWPSINGSAVRKRSARQETTMARNGISPEACSHEELRPSAIKGCNDATDSEQESMESDIDNTDEVLKYDMDVDEQVIVQSEIENEASFFVRINSRFGRWIKCNRYSVCYL